MSTKNSQFQTLQKEEKNVLKKNFTFLLLQRQPQKNILKKVAKRKEQVSPTCFLNRDYFLA